VSFGFGRTTVAAAQVTVDADVSGMKSGLKDAENQLHSTATRGASSAKGLSLGLGTLAKAGGALGVGFMAMKGASAIWDDFQQGQQVAAQTASVIKSTGNAAHVSAKGINELAGAISAKSGMDDDAIQSGENLLLTFTNVQNQAGKGNDVFNQATKTMADLSVAFGQDTKSSAIQLGKALNDPVKGMTALSRVGVSFTEGQAKTIKSMVAHNNVLGAQKLMLKVVNEQVAGSADAYGKTLPGMIDRSKQALLNLGDNALAKVAPLMAQGLTAVLKFANSKEFQKWCDKASEVMGKFFDDAKRVWNAIGPIIIAHIQHFLPFIRKIADVVADVARLVDALIHGKWGDAWKELKHLAVDAVQALIALLKGYMADIVGVLSNVIPKAKQAAGKIGGAIKDAIVGALSGIGHAVSGLIGDAINSLIDAANAGLNKIHDNWPDIPGAPGPPFGHDPIGHVAFGGPVRGGRAYIVGEMGPELVIPGGDSYVVDNRSLMKALAGAGQGGGGVVHITIQSLHPADSATLRTIANYVNQGQGMLNSSRLYSPVMSPGL
jgi:hypothetical protein